ncbi:MAG: ABC transporter permease [Candidatus Kariarchaeaceae archaeon]
MHSFNKLNEQSLKTRLTNSLIFSEIEKLRYGKKTIIALVSVTLIPLLFYLTSTFELRSGPNNMIQAPEDDGWQLIIQSMNFAMHIFIPLLAAMVAADTIAGEKSSGMLSLSMTKPVKRRDYLANKVAAQALFVSFLFVFFAAISTILGFILGFSEFVGFDAVGKITVDAVIPTDEIWWRMILFFLSGAFGSFIVATIAIFSSAYTGSVSTSTLIPVIFYLVTNILGGILAGTDYTKYLLAPAISTLLEVPVTQVIDWSVFFEAIAVLSVYGVVALGLAFYRFEKSDLS